MGVYHHGGKSRQIKMMTKASGRKSTVTTKNDHGHAGLDPHIWLFPRLVTIQAKHILGALAAADPENMDFYTANYNSFVKEIDALDQHLIQMLKDNAGMQFMVFHPSWGYFARDWRQK